MSYPDTTKVIPLRKTNSDMRATALGQGLQGKVGWKNPLAGRTGPPVAAETLAGEKHRQNAGKRGGPGCLCGDGLRGDRHLSAVRPSGPEQQKEPKPKAFC